MNNLKVSDLFRQCCVCRLPKAPEHHDREAVTHGYHKNCFADYHKDDFDKEDMDDMLENGKDWIK